MQGKTEDFYDSLDGSLNSSEISLQEIVPLYSGETNKGDILSKSRSRTPGGKASSQVCLDKGAKAEKSYVSLLYYKNGCDDGGRAVSTARAEKGSPGNSLSSGSTNTTAIFEDARDGCSDTTSFYENYIDGLSKDSEYDLCNNCLTLSSNSLWKLTSVSQQTLSRQACKPRKSKKCARPVPQTVSLGGLGPDLQTIREKQEFWKRRQSYGQKVSEENRIKMVKDKLLRNLKHEVEISKKSR